MSHCFCKIVNNQIHTYSIILNYCRVIFASQRLAELRTFPTMKKDLDEVVLSGLSRPVQ